MPASSILVYSCGAPFDLRIGARARVYSAQRLRAPGALTWETIGYREVDAVEPPTLVHLMGLTQIYRAECRRQGRAQAGHYTTKI